MLKSYKDDSEIGQYIQKHVSYIHEGMFTYPEHNCALPVAYKDIEHDILNMEVLPDDIWVISYPKTGTTWTQEMVWLLANGLDFEKAKVDLSKRFPFLEFAGLSKEINALIGISKDNLLTHVLDMKPPRFIKTHLPVGILPYKLWEVKPKIIYVAREPKDVALSYYNHYRLIAGYRGTKDKFLEGFVSNNSIMGGSYWANVAPFWKMRHQPNILFNTFEDMKKDLPSVVHRTAGFLGKSFPEEQILGLVDHLAFSNMKDNEFVNKTVFSRTLSQDHGYNKDRKFMNEGKVESYKENMSSDWNKIFDEWKLQEKIKYGLNQDEEFPY